MRSPAGLARTWFEVWKYSGNGRISDLREVHLREKLAQIKVASEVMNVL